MNYKTPYKVYQKKELLNEAINRREESQKRVIIFTLFFEINHLSFAVQYQPNYFTSTGLAHFSFHALSRGFEAFTSSGYHSIFAKGKGVASYEEIRTFIFEKLNEKMDIEQCSIQPLQLNLFEM